MFPAGPAGVGLALLRAACALQVAATMFPDSPPAWLAVIGAMAAAALTFGVLTRPIAIARLFVLAVDLLCHDRIFELAACVEALDLLALSLLGAGAYSFDAQLFGRRVIQF